MKYRASLILSTFVLLSLVSCRHPFQCYHKEFPYTHYPLPEEMPILEPEVVVVLGGGGARGMAHVGVLEELQKAHIPIDLVVGCSMGSLVAALYADHPDFERLKSLFWSMERKDFMEIDFTAMRYGLGRGDKFKAFLLKYLGPIEFRDTQIPLIVIATDLCTGELVQISSGPIAPAVQASCAYPFLFAPVKAYDRVLVDGGVADPVPVQVAQHYNPKLIIAIDLGDPGPPAFPDNLFGVAKCCTEIKFRRQSQSCIQGADVIILPKLGNVGLFQNGCNSEVYEAGREAARQAIPEIQHIMNMRGIHFKKG